MKKMTQISVRNKLDELIRQSDQDYTTVSLMLNRNRAYIQQFIKRGTPRSLAEADRKMLSQHFGVSEFELGAPYLDEAVKKESYPLPIHVISHIEPIEKAGLALSDNINIDPHILPDHLKYMRVTDDCMTPTLSPGDLIIVDTSNKMMQTDGIYLWHSNGHVFIRRATFNPIDASFLISCDNINRPDVEIDGPTSPNNTVEGRVIWVGKQL